MSETRPPWAQRAVAADADEAAARRAARAAAAAIVAGLAMADDQDRVHALRRALQYADAAMAHAQAALRAAPGPTGGAIDRLASARLASARHEAATALSLEHGEA